MNYLNTKFGWGPADAESRAHIEQILAVVTDAVAEGRLAFHPKDFYASHKIQVRHAGTAAVLLLCVAAGSSSKGCSNAGWRCEIWPAAHAYGDVEWHPVAHFAILHASAATFNCSAAAASVLCRWKKASRM